MHILNSEVYMETFESPEKGLYFIGVGQEKLIDGRYILTYLVDGQVAKNLL